MYNSQNSSPMEPPSSKQLLRSTILALLTALVLLVSVILPAEYAIDPTGIGHLLGLTQMGKIKQELAQETDTHGGFEMLPTDMPVKQISKEGGLTDSKIWQEEIQIVLDPGEGKELKLVMTKGAVAKFTWEARPGTVNFDMHGDGKEGASISYEKGFFLPSQKGDLTAAFDGQHGWFWRNREKIRVEVTLRISGEYSEVIRYF